VRQVGLFTIITPARPIKKPKSRTQRDREGAEMVERLRANAVLFAPMLSALRRLTGNLTRGYLLSLASKLCQGSDLRVDRVALRHKSGLICWFCEHFPHLIHHFQPFTAPVGLAEPPAAPVMAASSEDFDPLELLEVWEPLPDVWL
jgi:hypothetical protein